MKETDNSVKGYADEYWDSVASGSRIPTEAELEQLAVEARERAESERIQQN